MTETIEIVANSQFGEISGFSTSYATARNTSTDDSTGGQTRTVGQTFDGSLRFVYRFFLRFSASAIPLGSTILQAKMRLVCRVDGSGTNFNVEIAKVNWSSQVPITSGNRETVYDAGRVATLDAIWRNTGGMAINTKYLSNDLDVSRIIPGQFVYYGLRSSRDFSNIGPSGQEAIDIASPSYDADESFRPTLVVEYAPPARLFQAMVVGL